MEESASLDPSPFQMERPSHKLSYIFLILLILIIAGGAYLYITEKDLINQKLPVLNQITQITPPVNVQTQPENTVDTQKRIAFMKDPNKDVYQDEQVWILYQDGRTEQYPVSPVSSVFKYPNSSLMYYRKNYDEDPQLYIANLNTNETKPYTFISHPDKNVTENIQIHDISYISPDNKYILYNVSFFATCPTPIEQPKEGEFRDGGPCEPDPNPNFPGGYYVFDIHAQKSFYIGTEAFLSRWDTAKGLLYYKKSWFENGILGNSFYEYNLTSHVEKKLHSSEFFGYQAYPLFSKPFMIKNEGHTGNNDQSQSSTTFNLVNTQTSEVTTLASSLWGDLQPFVLIAPDEHAFIYQRTIVNGKGYSLSVLYKYSFTDNKVVQLTPDTPTESYSIRGVWLDNSNLITAVNVVDQENYSNGTNFLVKINIDTREMTRLTQGTDVYRFVSE